MLESNIQHIYSTYTPYLLIIYLIIAGNYTGNLFSCSVQRMLNNIYFKHFVSLSTLIIFVIYADMTDPIMSLLIGLGLYVWFVLTTRMDFEYILVLGLTFFVMYFLTKLDEYVDKHDSGDVHDDDKSVIYRFLKQYKHLFSKIRGYLFYAAIIITIVGFLVYLGRKSVEYEKNWSWFSFFEGSIHCKGDGDSTKGFSHRGLFMRGLQKTVGLV